MALSVPDYVSGLAGGSLLQSRQLLKDVYGTLFETHLHNGSATLQFLRPRRGRVGGRRTVHAVELGRPQGHHQALHEGAPLPQPTASRNVNVELDLKFFFYRNRDTTQVVTHMGGGQFSFSTHRAKENRAARTMARINAERKCITGQPDILGVVASHAVVGGTSVLTLDARDSRSSLAPHAAGGRYFAQNEGMSFSLVPVANGASGSPAAALVGTPANEIRVRSVTDPHGATPSITVERANDDNAGEAATLTGAPWSTTPADGDYLIPWGSRKATVTAGQGRMWDMASNWGLMDLFGSTVTDFIYGVSKAIEPSFAGGLYENGGTARQITEQLIAYYADITMNQNAGRVIDFSIMEHSLRREIATLYEANREYGPVPSRSGYAKVMMLQLGDHDIPTLTNWLFPVGYMVAGPRADYGWYTGLEYRPIDDGLARRFVPNRAQSEEVSVSAGNWANFSPANSFAMDDLIASTTAPAGGGV